MHPTETVENKRISRLKFNGFINEGERLVQSYSIGLPGYNQVRCTHEHYLAGVQLIGAYPLMFC